MLDVVDLNRTEQALYEALVDGPPTTTGALRTALGISPQRLRSALETLEAKGLVSRIPGSPTRYAATAPDVALEVLLLEKEERLHRARLYTEQLATRFHKAAASRDPAELVEVVSGRTAVIQRVEQVMRSARHEVRFIDKPPYAMSPIDLYPVEAELLRRGIHHRGLYDPTGLDAHDQCRDIEASISLGEQARILPRAPLKLILADDRLGIIPLQAAPAAIEAAVIIHPSALLEALSALFETLWTRAFPFSLTTDGQPPPTHDQPTPDEARVLALLTTGLPDETIAKHLGLSYRTLQRRLHHLMARLGAETRFQAGLNAAFLGWITPSNPKPSPPRGHNPDRRVPQGSNTSLEQ